MARLLARSGAQDTRPTAEKPRAPPSAAPCGSRRRGGSPSPFSIGFSAMASTRAANSSGSPSRAGKGTCPPRLACVSAGRPSSIGVRKRPGAIADDPHAGLREVARHRQHHRRHRALRGGVGDLADLALEGRDRGGGDDHAALAVRGDRDRARAIAAAAWVATWKVPIRFTAITRANSSGVVRPALAVDRARRRRDPGAGHDQPRRAVRRRGRASSAAATASGSVTSAASARPWTSPATARRGGGVAVEHADPHAARGRARARSRRRGPSRRR